MVIAIFIALIIFTIGFTAISATITARRESEARVRTILKKSHVNLDAVTFFRMPTDRGWMRDSGLICVKNAAGEVAFNNFVLPTIPKAFGAPDLLIGLLASTRSLEGAVIQPVVGGLSDRAWTPLGRGCGVRADRSPSAPPAIDPEEGRPARVRRPEPETRRDAGGRVPMEAEPVTARRKAERPA